MSAFSPCRPLRPFSRGTGINRRIILDCFFLSCQVGNGKITNGKSKLFFSHFPKTISNHRKSATTKRESPHTIQEKTRTCSKSKSCLAAFSQGLYFCADIKRCSVLLCFGEERHRKSSRDHDMKMCIQERSAASSALCRHMAAVLFVATSPCVTPSALFGHHIPHVLILDKTLILEHG